MEEVDILMFYATYLKRLGSFTGSLSGFARNFGLSSDVTRACLLLGVGGCEEVNMRCLPLESDEEGNQEILCLSWITSLTSFDLSGFSTDGDDESGLVAVNVGVDLTVRRYVGITTDLAVIYHVVSELLSLKGATLWKLKSVTTEMGIICLDDIFLGVR
ncbi:hypothetical protein V6N13_063786 [Hibiscus sabdariffa]|uniref:Uncharacterized protein n=1 Tax=Hibiscus sabdariffa TaxID=183260 RepID=A0ABR2R1G8_9ROSI